MLSSIFCGWNSCCLADGLTGYHTIPAFFNPVKGCLMKIFWEKEEMLVTSIFSFSHNVFYLSQNEFQFFSHIKFSVCKCFQFRTVQNLSYGKRVMA